MSESAQLTHSDEDVNSDEQLGGSTAFVQGQGRPDASASRGTAQCEHGAAPASDATSTAHVPRSLSADVFETARQLMRTYAAGLGGKSSPSESLAHSLFQLLSQHRGEELFALKHAVEATIPYSDPAWTACSLLAMAGNHVHCDAVGAFRALQRRELQALAPRARARVASVALLFDVDDTLTPALQDTSFPSVQAYPGLRAVVRRLAMRCAATGHLLRVGCLTARPGWLAWAVVSALRTAFHMPALVPDKHESKKGHTLPVSEKQHRAMSDVAAADIADGLAGDGRHAGLGSCDLLTGRLRDSLRIRSNSRNSAIAHTKSMNFHAFARMHPECVVVFCGDSGQGDAITALNMQKEALVTVQWDVSTPKPSAPPSPSAAVGGTPHSAPPSPDTPATLTPDAEILHAAVESAAAVPSAVLGAGSRSKWLCYACCGVIHDIVGLGYSGKQIPSTSALKRAQQRAQGVHIFDSYVEVAGVLGVLLPLLLAPRPGSGEPVWRTVDTDAVALAAVRDMHVPADAVIKHSHSHGAVTVGHLWAKDVGTAGSAAALDALHASTNLASPLPLLQAPQESAVGAATQAVTSALSRVGGAVNVEAGASLPPSTTPHPTPAQLRVMRELFNEASADDGGEEDSASRRLRRTNSDEGGQHPHLLQGTGARSVDDAAVGHAPASMLRAHSAGLGGQSAPAGAPIFGPGGGSTDEADARALHTALQSSEGGLHDTPPAARAGQAASPTSTLTGDLPAGVAITVPPPTAVSGVGAPPEAVRVQPEQEGGACASNIPPSAACSPQRLPSNTATSPSASAAAPPSFVSQGAPRPPPITVSQAQQSGLAQVVGTVRSSTTGSSSVTSRVASFSDRLRRGVPDAVLQEVYSWAKAYPSIAPFKFSSKVQGDHRLQELRVAMDTWCSWGGAGSHCARVSLAEADADGNCSAWVAPPPARDDSVAALLHQSSADLNTPGEKSVGTGQQTTFAVPGSTQGTPSKAQEEGLDIPSTRGTAKAITGPAARS